MLRNLLTTLLLSTGVPMLTAGDEIGRTQGGNNNAYCQDDETSWVDWDLRRGSTTCWPGPGRCSRCAATHPALGQDDFFEGRPVHADGRKDLAWFSADGHEMTDAEWFDHDRQVLGGYLAAARARSASRCSCCQHRPRRGRLRAAGRPLGDGVPLPARHHRRATRALRRRRPAAGSTVLLAPHSLCVLLLARTLT